MDGQEQQQDESQFKTFNPEVNDNLSVEGNFSDKEGEQVKAEESDDSLRIVPKMTHFEQDLST